MEKTSTKKNRKKKKYSKSFKLRVAALSAFVLLVLIAVIGVSFKAKDDREKREAERAYQEMLIREEEEYHQRKKATILEAEQMALGYDYEGAVELLQTIENYDTDKAILEMIAKFETQHASLKSVTMNQVTHIFFHSLIVDTELAFAGDDNTSDGFKQWMTTKQEFESIIQKMYENGYVLVSIYDLVRQSKNSDGKIEFLTNTIFLPEGKKPYVLSIDDLCYYHSYEGRGIASKLVLDENGDVTCEYVQKDGTVVTGAYDCVPILDQFIEEHPDAAYKGAKGTIGLTGYNGIFGYRTDSSYVTKADLGAKEWEWLKANPDFNWEEECAEAKKIAEALKANGWTFASNTWGKIAVGNASLERLKADTEKWIANVEPLVGKTDIISFSRGQDIGDWRDYSEENEKFQYLKSKGFNFFCNVDSAVSYSQIRTNYVRHGRRSLDGYRLWNDVHGTKNRTSDLFDVAQILDPRRTDMPSL